MNQRRQIITVLVGALAVCAISHADMIPVSPLDAADSRQSPCAPSLTNLGPASPSASFADLSGVFDPDLFLAGFLPPLDSRAGPTSETRPAQILTDRQDSRSLCLYALFGVGLCRSVPFVRKLHFSGIPDWYHAGGPHQVRHSFAISPDCLPSAPVFCFLQPDATSATEGALPTFSWRIVVSLWRQSQFTPAVLASRGPPCLS